MRRVVVPSFAGVGGDMCTTGVLRYAAAHPVVVLGRVPEVGASADLLSAVQVGCPQRGSVVSPMRIYIPATLTMLRRLVAAGELLPVSGTAFAVTPMLREAYAAGDTEELEYAAMNRAALASLRLLAVELEGDPAAIPRRVVVAADVERVAWRSDLDDAAVTLTSAVPASAVVAVHVDLAEAQDAVRAATAVVDAADLGDPDAELTLGDAEDHEMAWYATQEIPFLLELWDP